MRPRGLEPPPGKTRARPSALRKKRRYVQCVQLQRFRLETWQRHSFLVRSNSRRRGRRVLLRWLDQSLTQRSSQGTAGTRNTTMSLAWGGADRAARDQVKLYVGYLRKKMAGYGLVVSATETVRGFGYRY